MIAFYNSKPQKSGRHGYTLMEVMIVVVLIGVMVKFGMEGVGVVLRQAQCRRAQQYLITEYSKQAMIHAMNKPNYPFSPDYTINGAPWVTEYGQVDVKPNRRFPIGGWTINGPFYNCRVDIQDDAEQIVPLGPNNPRCTTIPPGRNYCPSPLRP